MLTLKEDYYNFLVNSFELIFEYIVNNRSSCCFFCLVRNTEWFLMLYNIQSMILNHKIWRLEGALEVTQASSLITSPQAKWPCVDLCPRRDRLQGAPHICWCSFCATHLPVDPLLMNMKYGQNWHFRSVLGLFLHYKFNLLLSLREGPMSHSVLRKYLLVSWVLQSAFPSASHHFPQCIFKGCSLWSCVTEKNLQRLHSCFFLLSEIIYVEKKSVGGYVFWRVPT